MLQKERFNGAAAVEALQQQRTAEAVEKQREMQLLQVVMQRVFMWSSLQVAVLLEFCSCCWLQEQCISLELQKKQLLIDQVSFAASGF